MIYLIPIVYHIILFFLNIKFNIIFKFIIYNLIFYFLLSKYILLNIIIVQNHKRKTAIIMCLHCLLIIIYFIIFLDNIILV